MKQAGEDRADNRRVPNQTWEHNKKHPLFPVKFQFHQGQKSLFCCPRWTNAGLGRSSGSAVTSPANGSDAGTEAEPPSSAARSGFVPLGDPPISSPVETGGRRQPTPAFARLCNSHSANPPTRASFHAWSSWKPWKMMLKAAVKGRDANRADSS